MTAQPTAGPATRTRHLTAGLAQPGAAARPATRTTRSGARGRALLAALGLALAAAILPATAVHASPQAPDGNDELTNQVGNPPPPEPPDPVQDGPEDLAPPTETPDPPLPPDPPDGPDDEANPTENPEPPNPTDDPDPAPPADDSIPTPQRVDAGFGGTAAGSHQLAGVALIAAALVLALLVVVIARRPLEA
jgi:uncharacterized protein HemX